MLGIIVAQKLRRKMTVTSTTSTIVNISVRCTSVKLALIEIERSLTIVSLTEGGIPACSFGSIDLMRSTSCNVFDPG